MNRIYIERGYLCVCVCVCVYGTFIEKTAMKRSSKTDSIRHYYQNIFPLKVVLENHWLKMALKVWLKMALGKPGHCPP